MIVLRSLLFTTLFYANLIVQMIVFFPVVLVSEDGTVWPIVRRWARSSLWLQAVIAGTRTRVTGLETLPAGPAIIASKHQSFWEIFALMTVLDRPTFILKKELMGVPLFGWYAKRLGMIPVDREKRGAALVSILKSAVLAVADGRQIVIFPEGTRTAPGADPEYRPGVHFLYARLGVPVVPVALNSGLFWPRGSVRRHAGTIRVEFLAPILPGLDRTALQEALRNAIEEGSIALLREAVTERPDLPVSDLVAARLRDL